MSHAPQQHWLKLRIINTLLGILLAGELLFVPACDDNKTAVAPSPALPVTAITPEQRTITQYVEATGTTEASARVDITPRITGTLQSIAYEDGELVYKDQLLFVIDPAPFAAKVAEARGNVAAQEAVRQRAAIEYQRNTRLYAQHAASQATVVSWREQLHNAEAELVAAKAALQSAAISLGYTSIRAPFTGHVSKHTADVGNTVTPSGTPLAFIVAYSPMYASFSAPAEQVLPLVDALRHQERTIPALLAVGDGTFDTRGTLSYIAPEIDNTSGTIRMRATFANADASLLPGMFVRVRVPVSEEQAVLVIPQQALVRTQGKTFVYTIGAHQTAALTPVRVGGMADDTHVAVLQGLTPKSRVIVSGTSRLRPGQKVTTE